MTLHSAKGLEFKKVFITGLEEGLFPHKINIEDLDKIQEERRLAYVGITRAKDELTLSYSQTRNMYGIDNYNKQSRFIDEIPKQFLKEINLKNKQKDNSFNKFTNINKNHPYSIGSIVKHPIFGIGSVKNYDGISKILIDFKNEGEKWLMLEFARLEQV